MGEGVIERLRTAIGYPDGVPEGSVAFTFRVDGAEIQVSAADGMLRLVCALEVSDEDLPRLADWAVGRMLREDAVLAALGSGSPFLWCEVRADAGENELRRTFEKFMDSCDWWRTRISEMSGDAGPRFPEVMIRP